MKEATMYQHNPNSAESVLTERLKDVSFAWVENQRAIVLEAMQAYADQQVNKVLDIALERKFGMENRFGDTLMVVRVDELAALKIKQP